MPETEDVLTFDTPRDVARHYWDEVEAFLSGENVLQLDHGSNARIWVSRHRDRNRSSSEQVGWDVLVIEPNGTGGPGQYEIAIRMVGLDDDVGWAGQNGRPGYVVGPNGMTPFNTDH